MSKDFINKIKGAIDKSKPVEEAEESSNNQKQQLSVEPVEQAKPIEQAPAAPQDQPKAKAKKPVTEQETPDPKIPDLRLKGFDILQNTLKSEKEGFLFNRRLVYIDDNIADVLDLLKREAKINSNVLASYLLKEFFLQNKALIKELRERKKGNIFFE